MSSNVKKKPQKHSHVHPFSFFFMYLFTMLQNQGISGLLSIIIENKQQQKDKAGYWASHKKESL